MDWWNVLYASSFVLGAALMSFLFGVQLELSLILAAARCVVQLTIMSTVLDLVLHARHVSVVVLMSLLFVILGAWEITYCRSKVSFKGMWGLMVIVLLMSNVVVAGVGMAWALQVTPFWLPRKFIPILGMLLGNSMSSVALATEASLDQMTVQTPILETRLAYGATRYEAFLPLMVEVLRLAMLPVITQLSVMGMVNVPGMLAGQIIAGTVMSDAIYYQECIMFMVAASSALGAVMAIMVCMSILIDKQHMLQTDILLESRLALHKLYLTHILHRPWWCFRIFYSPCMCCPRRIRPPLFRFDPTIEMRVRHEPR